MSSPAKPVSAAGSSSNTAASPVSEPSFFIETLLKDPANPTTSNRFIKQWKDDQSFRMQHSDIGKLIKILQGLKKSPPSVDIEKLKNLVQAWLPNDAARSEDVKAVVLGNLERELGKNQTDEVFKAVRGVVFPRGDTRAKGGEDAAEVSLSTTGTVTSTVQREQRDKYLNVGITFGNETVPLAILDLLGPVSSIPTQQNYFVVKPTIEVPVGKQVGMFRLALGTFKTKGLPGVDNGDFFGLNPNGESSDAGDDILGSGWRAGLDVGLVDSSTWRHNQSGCGLELTGVLSHRGEEVNVKAPEPILRLHCFKESEFSLLHQLSPLKNLPLFEEADFFDNMSLGVSTFLFAQETYLNLTNDSLLPEAQSTSFSNAGSLFAKNPMQLLIFSLRYHVNGVPVADEKVTVERLKAPFLEGEGLTKVLSLVPPAIITHNRSEEVAAFASSQTFFGTSLDTPTNRGQVKTLAFGLGFYGLQDGVLRGGNAVTRGEIWRRGELEDKVGMFLIDGANLLWNVIGAAAADGDPPVGQSDEDFLKDPGSVTDFTGRGHIIGLKLFIPELALSALDASGWAGNVTDKDQTLYKATSWAAFLGGGIGFILSGLLMGKGCAEGGILSCGTGSIQNDLFEPGPLANKQQMVEKMYRSEALYVTSTSFAELFGWGLTRLFLYP